MCCPVAPPREETLARKRLGRFSPQQIVNTMREFKNTKFSKNNEKEIRNKIKSFTGKATKKARKVQRVVFKITILRLLVRLILLGFLSLFHIHGILEFGVATGFIVFALFIAAIEEQTERKITVNNSEEDYSLATLSLPLQLYCLLPLNLISHVWGLLADIELSQPFSYFSVWLFAEATHCNRNEAEFDDLHSYKTVSKFFTRKLKPGLRPIAANSSLVSPADGMVTFSGLVDGLYLEQVKGVRYSLRAFLGSFDKIEQPSTLESKDEQLQTEESIRLNQLHFVSSLLNTQPSFPKASSCLYQTVVYLSPSDYHRFHSPASWTVTKRRHIPGKMFSVAPKVVTKIPGLFHTNERAAFLGRWEHGFFAMVAVGATNVGSIKVHFDEDFTTNTSSKNVSEKTYDVPIKFEKGDEFGYFNFGSTIVLIYEAPIGLPLDNEYMKRVKVGESMWLL